MTEATRALLGDQFVCEERGMIGVKGEEPMRTWWLRDETLRKQL
jgi:class 3 adenylate cyclase